jgi:hypothetical protein
MERAGKRIFQIIVQQKKCAFFRQYGIAKNLQERAMSERKAEKG